MDPLYSLKGIIYLIENTVNGKQYIGQTTRSFAQRYHGCQWWKRSNNPYLKAAVAKEGTEIFKITILEHSKTLEELNQLEEKYATEYNTYVPNGYNLVKCGDNKLQHPSSVLKRSRTVVLNNPEGRNVVITNIREFCRNNSLDGRAISRVLKEEHASHKGWTLANVTVKHHRNKKTYIIFEQNGTRHEIIGLTVFCNEKGLNYNQMRSMVQGKTAESQGYALSVKAFAKQRKKHIVTLVKDNEEIILNNIKKDCKVLGFHSPYVYKLINGKVPSYKGWTVKTLSSSPIEWGNTKI